MMCEYSVKTITHVIITLILMFSIFIREIACLPNNMLKKYSGFNKPGHRFISLVGMSDKNESKSMDVPKKESWDIGRFIRTANYYDAFRPKFLKNLFKNKKNPTSLIPGAIIWSNAKDAPKNISWGPLDDVVMGGASKSDISPGQEFSGRWTGVLSTANNGGFAGIRTKLFDPPLDLSSCRGLVFKIRGDGFRYKFIARDDEDWNGIAWSFSFETSKGKEIDIKVPFSKLIPTKYARTLSQDQQFNSKNVCGLQLSLSKFEYDGKLNPTFREGPFELNLTSVQTF